METTQKHSKFYPKISNDWSCWSHRMISDEFCFFNNVFNAYNVLQFNIVAKNDES